MQRDDTLLRICAILDRPGKFIAWLAAWVIVPMVGILVYDVISRYAFDSPVIWTYDITYMLYGSLFMLGAAYVLGENQHVRADVIYNRLPERWQATMDILVYLLLFFPALGAYTWISAHFAITSWQTDETMPSSPWMPIIYPYKTVMPVTGILLLIQGVSETLKSIVRLRHTRGERKAQNVES